MMSLRALIFLVMMSNVKALDAELKSFVQMESANRTELVQLLKVKFAEPLTDMISRAKQNAKVMALDEALQVVGTRLHPEAQSFLQEHHTHKEVAAHSVAKQHGARKSFMSNAGSSAVLDKAVGFINKEYKQVREVMDVKLLECGSFKIQKENELFETQDASDEIAIDLGLQNAVIQKNLGLKEENLAALSKLEAELASVKSECSKIRSELRKSVSLLQSDLKIIDTVIKETKATCANGLLQVHACVGDDGKTFFKAGNSLIQQQADQLKSQTAQQAFQQAMFAAYGMDASKLRAPINLHKMGGFDDDDSDDFPDMSEGESSFLQSSHSRNEVPSGTATTPSGQRCTGVMLPPQCPEILDKMDTIRGQTDDSLGIKNEELTKHNEECESEIEVLNGYIATENNALAVAVEEFNKAAAEAKGLAIQHESNKGHKREICKEMRGKYQQKVTSLN
jgi:hypothetical protein